MVRTSFHHFPIHDFLENGKSAYCISLRDDVWGPIACELLLPPFESGIVSSFHAGFEEDGFVWEIVAHGVESKSQRAE